MPAKAGVAARASIENHQVDTPVGPIAYPSPITIISRTGPGGP